MRNFYTLLMRYFGLFAAAVSFAMLVAAHSFELFGGLTPCVLCLDQRAAHWSAVGAGLVIGLAGRPRVRVIGLYILAAVYVLGTGLALYHVALEHHWIATSRCENPKPQMIDRALGWVMERVAGLFGFHKQTIQQGVAALLSGHAPPAPRCDQPAWWFIGLTMAGWNAVISFGMALLSLRAAWWRGART